MRQKTLLLLLLILPATLTLTQQTHADTQPEQVILPVPYYKATYGCALATTRMILAYALYPQQPPTEKELAAQMGLSTQLEWIGTPRDKQTLLLRRYIPEVYVSHRDGWSFQELRICIKLGFVIDLTVKGTIVNPSSTGTHAVLAIGYDWEGIYIHDPSGRAPCKYYQDQTLIGYWNVNGRFWGLGVQAKPSTIPSYTVNLNITPKVSTAKVDGTSTDVTMLRFPLGTSHTISVPDRIEVSNHTTQITYKCFIMSSINVQPIWEVREYPVNFYYTTEIRYLVKITIPQESRVEENWQQNGTIFRMNIGTESYPATGLWGQLGATIKFQGWYSLNQLLTRNPTLELQITEPTSVEARYTEDHSIAERNLEIIAAFGVALTLLVLLARKRQTHSHQHNRED